MEEWGVGPLSENDPEFSDLIEATWDRQVRIFNLKFMFDPLLLSGEGRADLAQMGGLVTGVDLEFGPRIPESTDGGPPLHGDVSQVIHFKAFDSVGEWFFFLVPSAFGLF
jgi:hypothetical protein